MSSTSNKILARAIGRRKSAIASVRLTSGDGSIMVNNLPVDKYFPAPAAKVRYLKPFDAVSSKKYSATVKVTGGGLSGQLDAMVLGLSRALVEVKGDFKPDLKKEGLLTRDPRTRQRRMVGTGGKARRQKQSPKR